MTDPRPKPSLLPEETYRALFESAPDAVLVIDSNGAIVAFNPQAERMFGYAVQELQGEPIERLLPSRFAARAQGPPDGIREQSRFASDGQRPRALGPAQERQRISRRDQPESRCAAPERTLISASVRDVTDRRRAQDELRKARDELEERVAERTAELAAQVRERELGSEQLRRQAEMLDVASEPIFAWDIEHGIVFWNKAAAETYGYTREEALGRVSHDLLRTVHPDGMAQLRQRLERDGRWSGEVLHTARDGRTIVSGKPDGRCCRRPPANGWCSNPAGTLRRAARRRKRCASRRRWRPSDSSPAESRTISTTS